MKKLFDWIKTTIIERVALRQSFYN